MAINREALEKEIERVNQLMNQIEFTAEMEENEDIKNALKSALGQIKAARTWLIKILKGL